MGQPKEKKHETQVKRFGLSGLDSSQNGQNSLIHNWCTGGCWFTLASQGEATDGTRKEGERLRQTAAAASCCPCCCGQAFFLSGMIRPVALDRSHCCPVL
jgi:hypothetical protein